MKYTKEFKTFKEQVLLLKNRGLKFEKIDENEAENILSHINYYKLSNYIKAFENPKDVYFEVDFADAMKLYEFDRDLSRILFGLVEKIEISFKTSLAHTISEYIINSTKNSDPFAYLDIKNWHDRKYIRDKKSAQEKENEFRQKICEYTNRDREKYIVDYFKKYNEEYVPLWVLIEIIDFGFACRMFSDSNIDIRKSIAKKYSILNYRDFNFYMKNLKFIRNKLAHNSYIWNLNLINKINKPIVTKIGDISTGRIFAVLIVIKELMKRIDSNYDYTILRNLINDFFCSYPKLLNKFGVETGDCQIVNKIFN